MLRSAPLEIEFPHTNSYIIEAAMESALLEAVDTFIFDCDGILLRIIIWSILNAHM
jgi:hypothetical protein